MDNVFDEINSRVDIKEIIEFYHQPMNRNNKVSCPLHHDKTPSLSVDSNKKMFKCFSAGCDFAGDGIKFVATLKKIDNIDAAKLIAHDFNLQIDFDKRELTPKQQSIKEYILECQKHLDKTKYLQSRGLTTETLEHFGVGYDVKREAIVIPYSSSLTYYQTRGVKDKRFFKPKTEDAGEEPLWNENALRKKDKRPIYIVESPICAMSIMQYGHTAVALCGTGKTRLVELCKRSKPTAPLMLCLDNDDAGKETTEKLVEMLRDLDVKHMVYNVADKCKDPNELLQKNPTKLLERLNQGLLQSKRISRGKDDLIPAEELFHTEMQPTRWLVKDMLPQGLTVIVAASKVGKSWMMMQLANAIIEGKEFLGKQTIFGEVVYVSLEDRQERLLRRMNWVWKKNEPTKGLYFKEECERLDTGLIPQMERILKAHKNIKLIIFDTFQKIRGSAMRNESAYAYDYREMTMLKNFADKYDISIVLIHHTRKQLDENDVFNMTSGSTAIMGASDTSMVIYKKKRTDENATLSITGRDVEQNEWIISRDKDTGIWSLVGSPEEEEKKRKEKEFQNSPMTKVLAKLKEQYPTGWKGTMLQIAQAYHDYFHEPFPMSDLEGGKLLRDYTYSQKLYALTKWEHQAKRRSSGMLHIFQVPQRKLWNDNQENE